MFSHHTVLGILHIVMTHSAAMNQLETSVHFFLIQTIHNQAVIAAKTHAELHMNFSLITIIALSLAFSHFIASLLPLPRNS